MVTISRLTTGSPYTIITPTTSFTFVGWSFFCIAIHIIIIASQIIDESLYFSFISIDRSLFISQQQVLVWCVNGVELIWTSLCYATAMIIWLVFCPHDKAKRSWEFSFKYLVWMLLNSTCNVIALNTNEIHYYFLLSPTIYFLNLSINT